MSLGLRLVIVSLLAAVWFALLGARHLMKPDEGRYAQIAREMAVSGDWLTPRLNAIKYFEKPPLQYWATAAAFKAFGSSEWTARLWTGATGFLGLLAVYFGAARLFGAWAGFYSTSFLASTTYYYSLAHINTLDMGLSFFLTLALVGFLLAQHSPRASRTERNWMLLAWAATALAALSKGLVAIVIPASVLILYSLAQRDFSPWRRLHLRWGIPLFLLIAAPWFVAVSWVNPEFPYFFFVHEHLLRYTSHLHRRDEPLWFFVPILLLGLLPWLVTPFRALLAARSHGTARGEFSAPTFLLVWVGFVFAFFSLSGSKLPAYLLPLFPALALLTGLWLARTPAGALWPDFLPASALGAVLLALTPWLLQRAQLHERAELYLRFAPWLIAAFANLLAGGLLAAWLCRRGHKTQALAAFAACGVVAATLGQLGYQAMSPSNSAFHIAQQMRARIAAHRPFYSVRSYDQTLGFYLSRTFTLVDFKDELEFGLQQEPQLAVPDLDEFKRRWREAGPAYAVMEPGLYEEFAREGLPMRVLARDLRRVIIATP